ncbi:MAG TPA: HAMP domain-containing protein [Candidatus Eremiobacteraceae bacterium]
MAKSLIGEPMIRSNGRANDGTTQQRKLLLALRAACKGNFSMRLAADATGLSGEIAEAFNELMELNRTTVSEIKRVNKVVGHEGRIGARASIGPVSGAWADYINSVNGLVDSVTYPLNEIDRVLGAVARGDLSLSVNCNSEGRVLRGEFLRSGELVNRMVAQLNGFASEVTRVAREVGSEGKLGGQAGVSGLAGTWRDLTDSVNSMARNLTNQVRNIAEVTTAVANGDLSKKITVHASGEILELKNTVNTMVVQLNAFASEVTRVAREVGSEGKLGGQAQVEGVAGTWKDLTDSVNSMALNLTSQVRNIAEVTTAVARGDLSKKITVDVKGELFELKRTINTMVDQLNAFASEVTRVAREVGSEGQLGGQAEVEGVGGTWKDLTDSVNSMARNLTGQVRNIATVTTAVANGDLSKKITVDVRGEILELKDTINTMVDQLNAFSSEVTRVAREVGSEGKLGGQAQVQGAGGTWKDLTDSVNSMAGNLTSQVRNIAEVTTAVARGDLSKKITVDVRGEMLALKDTINTMVDQLSGFASEVTRVAREVGSEGKLGGQAIVKGVAGIWKDLTDSVNSMAGNLTSQVRNIAEVTTAVAKGDLSRTITVDVRGEMLELRDTINTMVDQLNSFASEVTRVAKEVGSDGKLGGQAYVRGVGGTWKDLTDSVNSMAGNLTSQVRNIAQVTTAVANGDLSRKITVDVRGEMLDLKDTINTMVDQLNAFASEVTRVAREVGSEGKLGGQARVQGVAGIWKDLTDSVNLMGGNLTEQVRGIATVVTGVANGDLKRKLTLEAKGEIAALADTINGMIDTLATFADQVTTVAREVGFEGRLGGQASVPGAAGLWRDLTDNVNQLAANLTTQVRAIGEVATAVTKGDLSRTVEVEARGEVAALTDNVNKMIHNLRDTTTKNVEQDWLKTNLARFTGMLQGQRNLDTVANLIMTELAPLVDAHCGLFYLTEMTPAGRRILRLLAGFAVPDLESVCRIYDMGEGLIGQCALDKKPLIVDKLPPNYMHISTGLGGAPPTCIAVLPVVFEGETKAVIELASFERFSDIHLLLLDQLRERIGVVLNTLAANIRTEELLEQSQTLTVELQSQQEELRKTNEELEEKARLLFERNEEVEHRTKEIEDARMALEQKAEQLSLTSKYKSQFLANMSHELRTPLNSLLILSKQFATNAEGNLSPKQLEFASIIYAAANDLLTLINDILDLSKIESGTISIAVAPATLSEIREQTERTFRQLADHKGVEFNIAVDPQCPPSIETDVTRLHQILKNLLSNAFKFTAEGRVALNVRMADSHPLEEVKDPVVAFEVTDTGIGIPAEKQRVIFEAFQQADMTTARKYGGTGLGLSISREIAFRLGGTITVDSTPGVGSRFVFYCPVNVRVHTAPTDSGSINAESDRQADELSNELSLSSPAAVAAGMHSPISDDRAHITPRDRSILIIEDDPSFAQVMLALVRDRGFKGVVALSGAEGLDLAKRIGPDAITLDIRLPDMDGWSLLERLRSDPQCSAIPVHIISADERNAAGASPAVTRLRKPITEEALAGVLDKLFGFVDRKTKRVLIVEDDLGQLTAITELIKQGELEVTAVQSGREALVALREAHYHCIILDLQLPDVEGDALLRSIKADARHRDTPVIIYTGRELDSDDETRLSTLASAIIVKDGSAPERLLDEMALFFQKVETVLPPEKRSDSDGMQRANAALLDKNVLVVDDDARNVLAVTTGLEPFGLRCRSAASGHAAIAALAADPSIDLVLMDIMMPEMDGYETIRRIRADVRHTTLPIIALTAKAMQSDRESCIQAGASDYISKPVNIDQLAALMRIWLSR